MKNFTPALLGLLLFVPGLPAEVIDTVTFNPARLGQYERLKISDGLTSRGGAQTQSMQVQSRGGVSLENESHYQIPQVQINGSLNMPFTRFETPKLNSRGGTAYFDETAGADVQSRIDELTQTVLRVKANNLEVLNMEVKGAPSADYDGSTIQGLKLGGNDIPLKADCSGLEWVKRTDAQGNTYKVLGMKTCGGPAEQTCGENPKQEKCCTGCETWDGAQCKAPTCGGSKVLDPNTCECKINTCFIPKNFINAVIYTKNTGTKKYCQINADVRPRYNTVASCPTIRDVVLTCFPYGDTRVFTSSADAIKGGPFECTPGETAYMVLDDDPYSKCDAVNRDPTKTYWQSPAEVPWATIGTYYKGTSVPIRPYLCTTNCR